MLQNYDNDVLWKTLSTIVIRVGKWFELNQYGACKISKSICARERQRTYSWLSIFKVIHYIKDFPKARIGKTLKINGNAIKVRFTKLLDYVTFLYIKPTISMELNYTCN